MHHHMVSLSMKCMSLFTKCGSYKVDHGLSIYAEINKHPYLRIIMFSFPLSLPTPPLYNQ